MILLIAAGRAPGEVRFSVAERERGRSQTEQGVLAGLTAFIDHGGKTYQLIGFTAAQSLQAYDPAFRQSISSFGELTDPAALSRQPARLEVVKLEEDMTLEQAHQRYPSTVEVGQVALLNGVQAGATLKAGSHFKRVVGGTPAEPTIPTARAAEVSEESAPPPQEAEAAAVSR